MQRQKCRVCGKNISDEKHFENYLWCQECDLMFLPKDNLEKKTYNEAYYKRGSGLKGWGIMEWLVSRNITKLTKKKKPVVIDIGCGAGEFVNKAYKLGHNVWGEDISAGAIEAGRQKYPYLTSRLQWINESEKETDKRKYDLATAFHVIEHTDNPAKFVVSIKKRLKKGGRVVLRFPNRDCWEAKLAQKSWFHLDYPYHEYLLSANSVVKMLKESGFKKVRVNYFLLEYKQTLLYAFLGYLGITKLSVGMRIAVLPLQFVFIPMALGLALMRNSGVVEVIAER
jgi:2-polyprenyl-3-methyl-5-hydroxy-6-metoxy-1,4-benzoquinol methylase